MALAKTGVSTTGRTQPATGVWFVAEATALLATEPHTATAEAFEPKMLSATIGLSAGAPVILSAAATVGLICAGEAIAVDAEASGALADNAIATPSAIIFRETAPSIITLLIEERALDEKIHHVKVRYGDS